MNNPQRNRSIHKFIQEEEKRQSEEIQLIPSENFTSRDVRKALGSVLTHKYSEGQAGKRYYEGNEIIDQIESNCKRKALETFDLDDTWHVNVQAHAGSIANLAVYNALIEPGDKIMGMYLFDGGHLSHGWRFKGKKISLSSKIYKTAYYFVDPKTGKFNYDDIEKTVTKEKPKILISGGTAYPREIEHKKLSEIAKRVDAYYMADVAHEAGLIAAGLNQSPFPYADIITMTTQKTLRGPKGALIFCKNELSEKIDRSVFPGLQGGPMNNNIAAIAVALSETQSKEFKTYAKQVIKNTKTLEKELKKLNFNLVSDGTDKHLLVIDLRNKKIGGKYSARALRLAGITTNMNTIPNEPGSPADPSGIRLGTPFETTRGMKEKEMKKIAEWINDVIDLSKDFASFEFNEFQDRIGKINELEKIRKSIKNLCEKYTLQL